MISSREIGEQFNLRDDNPDFGGGILYALRYSPEMLELKKAQILDTIHAWGFEFAEFGENTIGIVSPDGQYDSSYGNRIFALAEELSVIGDAQFYQGLGWGVEQASVNDLVGSLTTHALNALNNLRTGGTKAKIDAYDIATMHIPSIVREVKVADLQNGVLSPSERRAVRNLEDVAQFLGRAVDGRHIILGL